VCRNFASVSSIRKNKSAGDRYLEKTVEKTILRILGSGRFSHSFGQMQKSTGLTLSTVWADALPVKQSEETPCPPN
jgi:hypothetical protein